jgi:carboxylate-amine ligase
LTPSEVRTVGVEEEFLVVDPHTGEPVGVAEVVVSAAAENGFPDELQTELQRQQLEVASLPRTALTELAEDLRGRRESASQWARCAGAEIAALGTSPLKGRPRPTANPRYERMVDRFGLIAREQLTCGCHVHVEVDSPEEGVAVIDRIRPWLPVLRAVSANSPFWQEQDSGFASYRTELWKRWPSAGPNEVWGSVQAYRDTVDALLATDTLLDDGMLYFDARLSQRYPTVEIRVADVCLYVADAVLVAALSRALVHTAALAWRAGEAPAPVRTEVLRLCHWRAAKSGLDGDLIDPRTWRPAPADEVVDALVEQVRPGLDAAGDGPAVAELLADVRARGTGARRQRDVLAEAGEWAAVTRAAVACTAEGIVSAAIS